MRPLLLAQRARALVAEAKAVLVRARCRDGEVAASGPRRSLVGADPVDAVQCQVCAQQLVQLPDRLEGHHVTRGAHDASQRQRESANVGAHVHHHVARLEHAAMNEVHLLLRPLAVSGEALRYVRIHGQHQHQAVARPRQTMHWHRSTGREHAVQRRQRARGDLLRALLPQAPRVSFAVPFARARVRILYAVAIDVCLVALNRSQCRGE